MEAHYIPKYLDAMPQLLWWELDELLFLVAGPLIGILTEHPLTGAGLGFLFLKTYSKTKSNRQPGYVWHLLYSYGLYGIPSRIPEYWILQFIR